MKRSPFKSKFRPRAKDAVNTNQFDFNAQIKLAESSRKLGDYREALKAAKYVMAEDPNNARAFAILVELYTIQGQPASANKVIIDATRKGLEAEAVTKEITPRIRSTKKPTYPKTTVNSFLKATLLHFFSCRE